MPGRSPWTSGSACASCPCRPSSSWGGRRGEFLECGGRHLTDDGRLAIAIADELEPFETSSTILGPLPDVQEIDGIVYSSRPTAVRVSGERFVLERRRETVTIDG